MQEIDMEIENFVQLFLEIALNNNKQIKGKVSGYYYRPEIRKSFNKERKTRRIWQTNIHKWNKTILKNFN